MLGVIIGALAVIALSALVCWWAIACRNGTLRRNWMLGYRTAFTLGSDEAWIAVHAAIAPWLFVSAAGGVVGALVAGLIGLLGEPGVAAPVLGTSVVWVFVLVVLAIIPAHACARRLQRASRTSG